MSTWTPYKIQVSIENIGRVIKTAKKKIIFKFGFADEGNLKKELQGHDCRGLEHEVQFTWSMLKGRRSILLNEDHIHYSETGHNGWMNDRLFHHPFELDVPNLGIFDCVISTQPINRDDPDSLHQFDLKINNVSYYKFNEIEKLGTPDMIVRLNGPIPKEDLTKEGNITQQQKRTSLLNIKSMMNSNMERQNIEQKLNTFRLESIRNLQKEEKNINKRLSSVHNINKRLSSVRLETIEDEETLKSMRNLRMQKRNIGQKLASFRVENDEETQKELIKAMSHDV